MAIKSNMDDTKYKHISENLFQKTVSGVTVYAPTGQRPEVKEKKKLQRIGLRKKRFVFQHDVKIAVHQYSPYKLIELE